MMSADVLAASTLRFATDPDQARSAPAVTASLVNGRAGLSAGPFNWDANLPAAIGGENLAPSATAYLLGALAGCAVAFIHDTLAPRPQQVALTPRERQVAALVVSGRTNRQIGRVLGISEKTAEVHLHHVMSKLDARSRAEVAAWAVTQHLSAPAR
jgi:DNA-binding CsgD family transcriptional regulator